MAVLLGLPLRVSTMGTRQGQRRLVLASRATYLPLCSSSRALRAAPSRGMEPSHIPHHALDIGDSVSPVAFPSVGPLSGPADVQDIRPLDCVHH